MLLFPRFLSSLRSRLKLLHPSPNCSLREENVVHVHFKEEIGIAELIPLVTTYIILFAYIYFSTRRFGGTCTAGTWVWSQGSRLLSVTPPHFPPVPAGEVVLELYPELSWRELVTLYLIAANLRLLASEVLLLVIHLPSWRCSPSLEASKAWDSGKCPFPRQGVERWIFNVPSKPNRSTIV